MTRHAAVTTAHVSRRAPEVRDDEDDPSIGRALRLAFHAGGLRERVTLHVVRDGGALEIVVRTTADVTIDQLATIAQTLRNLVRPNGPIRVRLA